MRRAVLLTLFAAAQLALATSTLSFSNDTYEVQLLVNSRDEITDFRLYGDAGLIRMAGREDFQDLHYDPARQTLRLVVPAGGGAPRVALEVRGKKAILTLGARRIKLKGDWVM